MPLNLCYEGSVQSDFINRTVFLDHIHLLTAYILLIYKYIVTNCGRLVWWVMKSNIQGYVRVSTCYVEQNNVPIVETKNRLIRQQMTGEFR